MKARLRSSAGIHPWRSARPAPPRRHRRGLPRPPIARRLALAVLLTMAMAALAPMTALAGAHGAAVSATQEAGEAHSQPTLLSTIARLTNFALLVGVLVYFLKSPIASYLASRGTQIRQDLVTAANMRATATAQLAEIRRRLESLPAELDALTARGAEDLRAEQARIAEAAAAERARLIDQTRREIATRLRLARRELTEHAAQLAIGIAEQRIRRSMTADDQLRLVDRFTTQLKAVR